MATKKKTTKKKDVGGRPTKYNPKYHNPWVRSLAREGLTGKQIAAELGIAESTLYKWASENPEFSECINEGRESADAMVEAAMFRKAIGCTITETRMIGAPNGNGGVTPAKVEKVTREVLPDTAACIFWLKNRQPDKWRDKREYEHQITDEMQEDELSKSLRELGESM